jgi:hypothetical protein
VNPHSRFTAGTSAGNEGFQGAMQGYGQQADILHQNYADPIAKTVCRLTFYDT